MSDWVAENRALTISEMENNADIIISYYRSLNYADKTIASILGNMQAESSISPVRTEVGGQGYGLVQWTPVSKLQSHCNTLGLSPYTSGDVQIEVLDKELGTSYGINSWYTSRAFINNYLSSGATPDMIGVTADEFKRNTNNFTVNELAVLFMVGYERPSTNPAVNHSTTRQMMSRQWYEYMGGTPTPPTPPTPPIPPFPPPFVGTGKGRGRRAVIFKHKYLQ